MLLLLKKTEQNPHLNVFSATAVDDCYLTL